MPIPVNPAEGFQEHASGLVVPARLALAREVWTRSEWRAVDRAVAILRAKKIQFAFACGDDPKCDKQPMRMSRKVGLRVWSCAHKDREFENSRGPSRIPR